MLFRSTVAGKEVITVESLRQPDGSLHPVQQAMVDQHASQCGFCTPGFVMSLFGLYLESPAPTREQVLDAVAGNLCRCTGYRPIIDAGLAMNGYPMPSRWSREEAQGPAHRERLASLTEGAVPGFRAPRSLEAFARAYAAAPESLILAGGTDVGLWVTKQLRALPPILSIAEVAELGVMAEADGCLEIGAAVRLTDAAQAITQRYPGLAELFNRFASPPIRNSGTLCGNIANGSPIGDSMPVLIALGAQVRLRRGEVARLLPLEDLYLDYRRNALAPGEFVQSVRVPMPSVAQSSSITHVGSYKVSKRHEQDISAVCLGYRLTLEGGRVAAVRLAYGGMAGIPKRALAAESVLKGAAWSLETARAAAAALASDFQPLSDMRATAAYRLQVAGNLLERLYHAHGAQGQPVRVTDVSPA